MATPSTDAGASPSTLSSAHMVEAVAPDVRSQASVTEKRQTQPQLSSMDTSDTAFEGVKANDDAGFLQAQLSARKFVSDVILKSLLTYTQHTPQHCADHLAVPQMAAEELPGSPKKKRDFHAFRTTT
jgi:hypothetical protein